jgi:hypothetical protein
VPRSCPSAWLQPPVVDPSIAVPEPDHAVVHAFAKGTQNYACASVGADAGSTFAWSLKGPDATLSDCQSGTIGSHFASASGAPEWQLSDGTYVVAHKAGAFAAGGRVAPWLLLRVDGHGGAGPLAEAHYVQRVHTVGGAPPAEVCDADHAGTVQKVPYEADYFFYAP